MRCLEKRPADRWQSAGELLVQLEAATTPSTGGMTPTGTTPVVSSGTEEAIRKSHPLRVGLLFGAASLGVLGLVYLLVHQLGLPDWVFYGAIALLLIGLPIMLITSRFERRRALARASGRVSVTPSDGLHRLFTWKKAIQGGIMAFAALGVIAVIYTAMRLLGIGPVGTLVASGRLSEKDRLVVADFENRTADPNLAGSITEAFRIDLGPVSCGADHEHRADQRRAATDAAGSEYPDHERRGARDRCTGRGQGGRRRGDQLGREGLRALGPHRERRGRRRAGGAAGDCAR